jgi:hypothetical protein
VGGTFLPLKIIFQKKKTEKKESHFNKAERRKTKRKRNKSRRVAEQHNKSAKPPYLPYHYAVVFWMGGAVGVRLTFATFLFFFGYIFKYLLYSIWHLNAKCNL